MTEQRPIDPFEQELRDALAALDRDPTETAGRIMANLPDAPWATPVEPESGPTQGEPTQGEHPAHPPLRTRSHRPRHARPEPQPAAPRGLPPSLWWVTAAALAVGFGLGWWLGAQTSAEAPRLVTQSTGLNGAQNRGNQGDPAGNQVGPAGPGAVDPKPDKPVQPVVLPREGIEARLLGPVTVVEPGAPPELLDPNNYLMAVGTRFETGESQAGGIHYAEDVMFRLDRGTVATIGGEGYRRADVETGRAWLAVSPGESLRVAIPQGELALTAGAMMVVVDRERTEVLCLEGEAEARTTEGETAAAVTGQTLTVRRGERPRVGAADFAGPATSWMTNFIRLQLDDTELRKRIATMVEALTDERYRDDAAREILMLGPHSVPYLLQILRDSRDRDLQATATDLIDRVADFHSAPALLPWLMAEDARVRRGIFDTLVRVTAMDVGTSARFWDEAPVAEREAALREWQAAVGR